jgi:hypothetical protein
MALKSRLADERDSETGQSADSTNSTGGNGETRSGIVSFDPVGANADPFSMNYATERFNIDVDEGDQLVGLAVAITNLL